MAEAGRGQEMEVQSLEALPPRVDHLIGLLKEESKSARQGAHKAGRLATLFFLGTSLAAVAGCETMNPGMQIDPAIEKQFDRAAEVVLDTGIKAALGVSTEESRRRQVGNALKNAIRNSARIASRG